MIRPGRALPILIRLLCAALTTGLIFTAASASAQDDWEEEGLYSEPGPYVQLGGSIGIPNFSGTIGRENKSKGVNADVSNVASLGGGLNFKLGSRAIEWVAYELQFEYIAAADYDAYIVPKDSDPDDIAPGTPKDYIKPNIFTTTVNIKVFPLHSVLDGVLGGRIQPYIVAGFGMMNATDTGIQTPISLATRGTLGVEGYINEEWSLFLDAGYVYTWGNLKGLDYISTSLGAAYHF